VVTGTARQEMTEDANAETGIGSVFGEVGTTSGGLVVLRDEVGILSVMRCLDADLTADPGFQYAYPAESAALAGLSEPRLAPPLSYVVDAAGQIVATVCRHVTGVRLSKVLTQLPRGLDVQTAAMVAKDVLTALDALHARGVAHRAPDADHVIIEPNGNCVLVDVGLVARSAEADPDADLAADLDLVAELFLTCLIPGRLLPDHNSRPGYFAADELEGVAARLYTALTEPEPDPEAPDAAVAPITAALLYRELEAVAADSFDAGWDGRGRERLAVAAKDHRSARRRFLEFRPTGQGDRRWSIRGWHAGSPRSSRSRQRLVASAAVMRQARAQLVELWAGAGTGGRGADRRGAGSHAAGGSGSRLIRYLIPLIAFLLAFGLALLFLGSSSPSPASTVLNPALASHPNVGALSNAPNANDLPKARLSNNRAAPMNTLPLVSKTAPYTPPPSPAAPAAATKITVLDITGLTYFPGQPGKAVVTIGVQASGTAPLTVTVTFRTAGPGYGGYYGGMGGTQTDHFALSGKSSYTVTDTTYASAYCGQYGRVLAASVSVSGIVNSVPATVSSASGNVYAC
jgi:serine/threonine protein kinase